VPTMFLAVARPALGKIPTDNSVCYFAASLNCRINCDQRGISCSFWGKKTLR